MRDEQHPRFADWDGAYVLGALTSADRHAYEEHLEQCVRCRQAVGELAPMPGLLSQIRPEPKDVAPTAPDRPTILPLDVVRSSSTTPEAARSRRPRRRLLAGALAAASVLVLAVALPLTLGDQGGDDSVVAVSPGAAGGGPAPMRVDVELAPAAWGTALTITCDYPSASPAGPGAYYGDSGPPPAYALVVTAEDGTRSQVSSWQGVPGEVVTLEAGTAIDLADIAAVSVVDPAGTTVLTAEVDAP